MITTISVAMGQQTVRVNDVEVELSKAIYHCVGTDQTNPFVLIMCASYPRTSYPSLTT